MGASTNRPCACAIVIACSLVAVVCCAREPTKALGTRLGVRESQFTLNGKPAFLLGISYYGGLGAPEEIARRDLAEMKRRGFNWLRVWATWATWAAFGKDFSAVDAQGRPREAYFKKLVWLVGECDREGLVVDVTLSRGNGVTGPSRLQSLKAHRRAVETIVNALQDRGNWYLDLANERNISDQRFVSFDELRELRELVRKLDPTRLVTASHGGDISEEELGKYLEKVRVDFISPHRPRHAKSPAETEAKSREYLARMREQKRIVPLLYQEPFRRAYGEWDPSAEDFLAHLRGAKAGGAAGWCFHNGATRGKTDQQPRRSFDLSRRSLFQQLDEEERRAVQALSESLRR